MHAVLSQSESWRDLEILPRMVNLKSVWLRAIRNKKQFNPHGILAGAL